MEAVMKVHTMDFEGTPEEYVKTFGALRGTSNGSVTPLAETSPALAEVPGNNEESNEKVEVSPEFLLRALTRISLSTNQRKVLELVSKASKPGLTSEEIAHKVGLTRAQLAGVWGALGRRLANTRGYPEGGTSIDWKWDPDIRQYRYWALQVLRDVMSSGKV
jgi:hypothetical protein